MIPRAIIAARPGSKGSPLVSRGTSEGADSDQGAVVSRDTKGEASHVSAAGGGD